MLGAETLAGPPEMWAASQNGNTFDCTVAMTGRPANSDCQASEGIVMISPATPAKT
jgi:hypothetical protein